MNRRHRDDPLQLETLGTDRGRGNLLGIQPWVTPADYASADTLLAKLGGYLEIAKREGWVKANTIAVFPEYLGTWLLVAEGGRLARRAARLNQAMIALALRRPARVVAAVLGSRERDRMAAGLFRSGAQALAHAYQDVFSCLARDFGITVVAGSTVLPDARVRDGKVEAGEGPLHGVSAVFAPDGQAHPHLVRKAYPTSAELPFLTPGSPDDLPVFETPAGRLGVLICADSWYPDCYRRLDAQGVELIAVPSYAAKQGCWDEPWHGYDGAQAPEDVDLAHAGRLTEAEAWRVYALAGRISSTGARAGINVYLSGSLWDLGAEGASLMVRPGEQVMEVDPAQPTLLSLWL